MTTTTTTTTAGRNMSLDRGVSFRPWAVQNRVAVCTSGVEILQNDLIAQKTFFSRTEGFVWNFFIVSIYFVFWHNCLQCTTHITSWAPAKVGYWWHKTHVSSDIILYFMMFWWWTSFTAVRLQGGDVDVYDACWCHTVYQILRRCMLGTCCTTRYGVGLTQAEQLWWGP